MENKINSNILEVLRARAERVKNRKPLTPEEIREIVKNGPFFKKIEEMKEKMNKLNKKEE